MKIVLMLVNVCIPSMSPEIHFDWMRYGHMSTMDPITVVGQMEYSHSLSLGSMPHGALGRYTSLESCGNLCQKLWGREMDPGKATTNVHNKSQADFGTLGRWADCRGSASIYGRDCLDMLC